jgi:hypothetical protein
MITQSELKQILDYNPDTGIFTWKINCRNSKLGKVAGCMHHTGYICITINQKQYQLHRLAWLYMHGETPKNQIDHINCIKDDNRIINLRECTIKQNAFNRKISVTNTSGVKGISFNKHLKKWTAYINGKGLGYFSDINEAKDILMKKRIELHNEFANHG